MSRDARRLVIRSVSKPYELRYYPRPGQRGDWHSRGLAYDRLQWAIDRRDRLNRELPKARKDEGAHWEIVTFKAELMREDVMRKTTKEGGYYAE